MTERERTKLEAWARTAAPPALRAMTKSARDEEAVIAVREITRREREAADRNSLTGVVEPL